MTKTMTKLLTALMVLTSLNACASNPSASSQDASSQDASNQAASNPYALSQYNLDVVFENRLNSINPEGLSNEAKCEMLKDSYDYGYAAIVPFCVIMSH